MSEAWTEKERRLLEAVVAGERDPADPEVVARARANPVFERRINELREVTELLEGASRDALDVRREAASLSGAPGEERLAATVGLRRPEANAEPAGRRAPLIGVLLAVAAGLLLLWLLRPEDERTEREEADPVWMGGQVAEVLAPCGWIERFEVFAWEGSLPEGGEYRIRVREANGAAPAGEPLLEHRTQETRWTPSEAELRVFEPGGRAASVRRFWVEVAVVGADGTVQPGGRCLVER